MHRYSPGARPCTWHPAALMLLLVVLPTDAQVVPFASPESVSRKCQSITQCFIMGLGRPRTHGEWLTAYVSALHEHCAGLLEQDGPQQCEDSTRCQLLPANGEVGRASLSSSSTSTNGYPAASFLTTNNSSSSSMATAADPAYWKFVASSLQLLHVACLPIPAQLDDSRSQACRPQQAGHSAAAAFPASTGLQQYTKMCEGNPSACLVSNASIAANMAAWWTGQGPQEALEEDSSWRKGDKLQRVAEACTSRWAAHDQHVTDACATRGVSRTPWNNTLTLNRLVVALMDAYESSACNNTVTFSEALAVERIVDDICSGAGCSVASGAILAGSGPGFVPLLAAVAVLAAGLLAWL